MASITITLTDLPEAQVQISTDAERPVVGSGVSPAGAIAMELLGTAFKRGCHVIYDAKEVPLIALALELIDPDGFGFSVTQEVRDRARRVLGRGAVARPIEDGVNIDRVHLLRQGGAL